MNNSTISKLYSKYVNLYDFIFGKPLDQGRKKVLHQMNIQPNQEILEVGIGTGLSLKHYPKAHKINIKGIDLSKEMLKKAAIRGRKFNNINLSVEEINGEETPYHDNSFDKVILMYVYSVTPSPKNLLAEAIRVCKPDGDIFIVNHFSHYKTQRLTFSEKIVSSASHIVGFKSNFSFNKYMQHVNIENIDDANLFSLTKIIQLKKHKNLHLVKTNRAS